MFTRHYFDDDNQNIQKFDPNRLHVIEKLSQKLNRGRYYTVKHFAEQRNKHPEVENVRFYQDTNTGVVVAKLYS